MEMRAGVDDIRPRDFLSNYRIGPFPYLMLTVGRAVRESAKQRQS